MLSGIVNRIVLDLFSNFNRQNPVVTSCEPIVQMNFSTWTSHGKQNTGGEG